MTDERDMILELDCARRCDWRWRLSGRVGASQALLLASGYLAQHPFDCHRLIITGAGHKFLANAGAGATREAFR